MDSYTVDDGDQGNWERVAAAAYTRAGIAVDRAQLASTARALRRLDPVFAQPGPPAACSESFAGVLEEFVRD